MQPEPTQTASAPSRRRTPVSSYRLQFHRGFRFVDARALVPYLDQLGITDCYSSPYLQARPGSTHGYDICDHNQLNPEIGSEEDYAAFTAALTAHGMGQIVDFAPNHMAADETHNPWWRDVLTNGPCSSFAGFFDIDWEPVKAELKDKVLLPVLGDRYGAVLDRGELRLVFAHGVFALHYCERNFPINPRQLTQVLEYDLDTLRRNLGETHPRLLEYLSIATALRNLPAYTETDPQRIVERQREQEVARERLQRLAESAPEVERHILNSVRAFNGQPGEPASFDRLHALLEVQPYRLAYWRTAAHEINYRRFFDINQLAGIRTDDPRVFDAMHGLLLRLIREGSVTGLRIDHIDGLFAPRQYLKRLQEVIREQPEPPSTEAPFYIVTEKILSPGESLPDWPVAGTSGYDFLNDVNGLFVDRDKRRMLARVYHRFTRQPSSFADHAYASKKLIMDTSMASELNVLAHALNRYSEHDRHTRDFTLNSLRDALQEVIACFPIYRTYVMPNGYTEDDRRAIDVAIQRARRRNPTVEPSIFDFVRSVLLPDAATARSADDHRETATLAMKFQQYSGPVQAKGVEDTAFYRYNLLASLNEVGGNPDGFGRLPAEFHAANQRRRERWPTGMLATATHDTKRGEDVRARLNVISELPEEWGHHLSTWARINNANRTVVEGEPAPDRNDEYLFYQALLGTWPPEVLGGEPTPGEALVSRLREYMLKAVREAKAHTSWITQNPAYEQAVTRFVERTLSGPTAARFLAAFLPFQNHIARLGMVNSLSQLVLKVMSPGVPDFYQGTELWDLSLVDPDNRRPVDYGARRRLLEGLEPLLQTPQERVHERIDAVRDMLVCWSDGRIKLFVTAALLRLRRQLATLFLTGRYEAIEAQGERADHVIALVRRHDQDTVIAVVPRLLASLTAATHFLPIGTESWGHTRLLLPLTIGWGAYRNVLTGEALRVERRDGQTNLSLAAVLSVCPVGVLRRIEGGDAPAD
jgi:(1->4)-alpha-D-glucan 1-alpha-D-glucosylmutase